MPPRSGYPADPSGRVAFAPVFYPGTTRASQARLITVAPGEERAAIDIELEYVPIARIAGTVIGSGGASSPAYVRLVPDPEETLAGQNAFRGITTNPDGAFAFDAVPALADRGSVERLRARAGQLQFDDAINIQFTSGTTGAPTGATLTSRR